MNNYKHQLSRNKYDDAYVMGYHNGYHAVKYDNQYDPEEHSNYHIKFKMGYCLIPKQTGSYLVQWTSCRTRMIQFNGLIVYRC